MRYDCSSPQALRQCRGDRGRDWRLRTNPKMPAVVRQDRRAKKSLHFVGYEGMSMIAVAGLDMAAWDALAGEASVPLCALAGGSIGLVPACNSNGSG